MTISILGCGWLGLPLGAHLAARGHRVLGSTTTPAKRPQLEAAGIRPFVVTLTEAGDVDGDAGLFDADVLVLDVPPRRGAAEQYPAMIAAAGRAAAACGVRHVLFASATSVYPDVDREVTEADAGPGGRASGAALREAEAILSEDGAFDVTILRYGGLYGYDRDPGRFLAGRTDVASPEAPVNLVHRDDAIGAAVAVIEKDAWGEVFNVVADGHPTRRAFYVAAAERLGLEPPTFRATPGGGKWVSNRHLKHRLGYVFHHPDPLRDAS